MKRVLILLLRFNRIHAAQLLHHTGIEPRAFFQLRCNDETLALQLCHLRLHISLTVHGKSLCRQLTGVIAKDSGDGIPEGRLTICTSTVGDYHMLGIYLSNSSHADNLLYIVDKLLILTEEKLQGILPKLLPLIARSTCRDLGDEVIRIMRMHSFYPLTKVKCACRRV